MATTTTPSNVSGAVPANQPATASNPGLVQMQLVRFPRQMLTNVFPPRPIPHKPRKRRRKKGFDILGLPTELFVMVMRDYLTIFDRASFALVCKAFAQKVTSFHTWLQLPAPNQDPAFIETRTFFRHTMRSWFPNHLRFCHICGKYVPREREYWEEILFKECVGHGGNTARNFFAWTASDNEWTNMEHHYEVWETSVQSRTCPRCKLHTRHF
ncbi:hypothetical protein GJ744_004360 [Endocarpon pusillum]|uniref:F-box domain-containing protein n=1 Tax=Endocarpon pusillum TaxID=364733 RepID=A0A8H7ARA4_9EURO|nr:hypothetical protein GJ744_004360 [Endocarpon pusillum]